MSDARRILALVTQAVMRAFQQFYPMQEYVDPVGAVERMAAELAAARARIAAIERSLEKAADHSEGR